MTPRKVPTPLTADQLVAAVTKRTQTRAARHTLGSKQTVIAISDEHLRGLGRTVELSAVA